MPTTPKVVRTFRTASLLAYVPRPTLLPYESGLVSFAEPWSASQQASWDYVKSKSGCGASPSYFDLEFLHFFDMYDFTLSRLFFCNY
eukprot:scaffold29318_cov65-Attheya_sp.AAC.7